MILTQRKSSPQTRLPDLHGSMKVMDVNRRKQEKAMAVPVRWYALDRLSLKVRQATEFESSSERRTEVNASLLTKIKS